MKKSILLLLVMSLSGLADAHECPETRQVQQDRRSYCQGMCADMRNGWGYQACVMGCMQRTKKLELELKLLLDEEL